MTRSLWTGPAAGRGTVDSRHGLEMLEPRLLLASDGFADTLDTADDLGTISQSATLSRIELVGANDDADFYRFRLQGPGKAKSRVVVTLGALIRDADLFVYRANGRQIGSSRRAGPDAEKIKLKLKNGSYGVEVRYFLPGNEDFQTSYEMQVRAKIKASSPNPNPNPNPNPGPGPGNPGQPGKGGQIVLEGDTVKVAGLSPGGRSHDLFSVTKGGNGNFAFAAQQAADAFIIPASDAASFQAGGAFSYFYAFQGQFGQININLPVGNYALAVRNNSSVGNSMTASVTERRTGTPDFIRRIAGPSTEILNPGTRLWQPFTLNATTRVRIGVLASDTIDMAPAYIIPANQLSAWQNGQSFTYFSVLSWHNNVTFDKPILAAGSYHLVFRKGQSFGSDLPTTIVYNVEAVEF